MHPQAPSPISIGWPSTSSFSRSTSLSTSPTSSASSSYSSSSSPWTAPYYSSTYHHSLSCAFPSWPSRNSLSPPLQPNNDSSFSAQNADSLPPSAYISDFDLFPEDLPDPSHVPLLDEAPAPPREYKPPPVEVQILKPLYAPHRKPYSDKPVQKRRSSSKKTRPLANPMPVIKESAPA